MTPRSQSEIRAVNREPMESVNQNMKGAEFLVGKHSKTAMLRRVLKNENPILVDC